MKTSVAGDVLEIADSDNDRRQGSMKFAGLRKLRLDSFLPDDLRRQALVLGHSTELRVASIVKSLVDTSKVLWKNMRDRGFLRGNGGVDKD
jgi:hypothetical protein